MKQKITPTISVEPNLDEANLNKPSIDNHIETRCQAHNAAHNKSSLLVGLALKREALSVHDVPVQHVVLGIGQGIDGLLNEGNGLEVTGRVQQHTCILKL